MLIGHKLTPWHLRWCRQAFVQLSAELIEPVYP
jgi:hypothetical protein